MNLYLITRNDYGDWDEYEGFVVRASSKGNALKLCQGLACDYFGGTYFTDVTIEVLATNVVGNEEIILSDYNAG